MPPALNANVFAVAVGVLYIVHCDGMDIYIIMKQNMIHVVYLPLSKPPTFAKN